jgi:hypothetical protein
LGRVASPVRDDPLEGVPEIAVGTGNLVDREIRFKHASIGAESVDHEFEVGPPGGCECKRLRRRLRFVFEFESVDRHPAATELGNDIRAGSDFLDPALPYLEDLGRSLAREGADRNRTADVVEHDLDVRKSAREVGHLGHLEVIAPAFKDQAARSEFGKAGSEFVTPKEVLDLPGPMMIFRNVRRGVEAMGLPDAAKRSPGRHQGVESWTHGGAGHEVRKADGRAAAASPLAEEIRFGGGRNALDELDFTTGGERAGPLSVHRETLDEDCVDDVMPRANDVVDQLVAEITTVRRCRLVVVVGAAPIPEMVMRVDDRLLGIEWRFGALGLPFVEGVAVDVGR